MKRNYNSQFRFTFPTGFRNKFSSKSYVAKCHQNSYGKRERSMKYLTSKKIPWVWGLIFPLVRFYDFGISGINDKNSEVNKSWQIYFLLT